MHLQETSRFWVLTVSPIYSLPTLELSRLLNSDDCRHDLLDALRESGFVVLTLPRDSLPGRIVRDMKASLTRDFFPGASFRGTGDEIYVSERGVPMWKVGYEPLEDRVREAFRVAAGYPDAVPWPSQSARSNWLRGLALCRHICDRALHVSLSSSSSSTSPKMKKRPGSGAATWKKTEYCTSKQGTLRDRSGDFSVLYAMNYFNHDETPYVGQEGDVRINVKEHVDPSLFVLEPFLAEEPGLQVWSKGSWITCDGSASPIHGVVRQDEMGMVMFVGKAFAAHVKEIQPTLHRVIAANGQGRRTMIYEQKYEEFFD